MKLVLEPGFERELDALPGSIAKRTVAAKQVKNFAIGLAPRGVSDNYAASIDVVQQGQKVYVRTNDFAGHMVEWGSANNPPYAPIRRAVRAAGLRLDEQPK